MPHQGQNENAVEHTFEALERFEHSNQLDRTENTRILGRNLDGDLKIFAHVDAGHLVHAREQLISGQPTEIVHKPLKTMDH